MWYSKNIFVNLILNKLSFFKVYLYKLSTTNYILQVLESLYYINWFSTRKLDSLVFFGQ